MLALIINFLQIIIWFDQSKLQTILVVHDIVFDIMYHYSD